jgi:hypothetical protein
MMAKYLLLKHYRGGPAPAVDWAPMDQRISRAKRTVSGVRFNQPRDVATVLRVICAPRS